jgi:hypothetical protein
MHRCGPALALVISTLGALAARAQTDIPGEFERATERFDHVRREVMIPMRDGVKLFTVIMIPKHARGPKPIVLTRTPYSAAKATTRSSSPDMAVSLPLADEPLVRGGYIRVYQDVRGKYKSEGDYVMTLPPRGPLNAGAFDHATDTWDTVDWLVKNVPDNNGKVGITGVSYAGFLTLMALLVPHPALKAAVPVNALVDGWVGDDWYHNGAFRPFSLEYIYHQTTGKSSDEVVPFGHYDIYSAMLEAGSVGELGRRLNADRLPAWNRLLENPAYNAFWQEQALDRLLSRVPLKVPTLTVHSLFDQEDIYGPIASYRALEEKDKGNKLNYLAIGPWVHGQSWREGSTVGKIPWGADTSLHFREKFLQPFWDEHLKGVKPARPTPPVLAFETGVNEWRQHDSWPPRGKVRPTRLYLQAGGQLSFDSPVASGPGFDEYVSDPAKPVPYRVRPIRALFADHSGWRLWLSDDQRPFSDRPDVLTFVGDTLRQPLTVAGEIAATLFASTSGSDSDWVVKLIDLYPDEVASQPELGGYQLMISADILRGRYRESFERAAPIPPGEVLPYKIRMPHASHTFLPGHRIMVQVQSTWFPVYDRNPQTFLENIAWAKPGDYRRATQRIYHSPGSASFVDLPVSSGASTQR